MHKYTRIWKYKIFSRFFFFFIRIFYPFCNVHTNITLMFEIYYPTVSLKRIIHSQGSFNNSVPNFSLWIIYQKLCFKFFCLFFSRTRTASTIFFLYSPTFNEVPQRKLPFEVLPSKYFVIQATGHYSSWIGNIYPIQFKLTSFASGCSQWFC